ncbi:hypothetical protein BD626DRAFT_431137 [Schizophyllum amplum]|uniref:Molybdate-anion transporter n=1 Tax=Schizophyllum amplum TaxID=97359 RepID=A0A550CF13_9AGAR|nr:hypothetical protein BD626DRAFT_431137 [Auriculariopsis ampla]
MPVNFYEFNLILLSGFCLCWLLIERRVASNKRHAKDKTKDDHHDTLEQHGRGGKLTKPVGAESLEKQYLLVYAIVMGADWLQGPYVYSLYRDEYGFPERIVAILFVTGFLSAGLAAPWVGAWADTYGRKRICLAFCVSYAASCVLIQFPLLPVLFAGRVLGGLSTSILFSAFESWLVSAAGQHGVTQGDLSGIMGRATLLNGFVATAAGVVSDQLVQIGTKSSEAAHEGHGAYRAPFVASGMLLVIAWMVIGATWGENFGGSASAAASGETKKLIQAWKIVSKDPVLLTLGLTQTCFEGSMYLFVFLWVPSLQEARAPGPPEPLPLGYIFSSFMVSMMLGSQLYSTVVEHLLPPPPPAAQAAAERDTKAVTNDPSLTLHAKLSSVVCALSALALAASVSSDSARVRFWAFCALEACVGMYYPVQGMLRGSLIQDDVRATLSSLIRVPLNVFVVVSLVAGASSARYAVLTASAVALAFSSLMTGAVIVKKADARIAEQRAA